MINKCSEGCQLISNVFNAPLIFDYHIVDIKASSNN